MTNRRRSATTRSVPAQTPEQLLELTQEHIRPLIVWASTERVVAERRRLLMDQPSRRTETR